MARRQFFRQRDTDGLRWFWERYLKERTPWLILVMCLLAIQGLVYQQFLSLTENGLRVIFEKGEPSDLIRICITVFLLFTMRGILSYVVPVMSAWLASTAVEKMRFEIIDRLMILDLEWFERTKSGDIILRLVMQAEKLSLFVGQTTVKAARDAVTVVVVSGWLLWKSPLLFAAALISIPPIILLLQAVAHRVKKIQLQAEGATGDYMNAIEEMAGGMRTVKISGQEENERQRLKNTTTGIRQINIKLHAAKALTGPTIDFVSAFIYALVIGGGGYLALTGAGGMDSAGVIAFLLGLVILFDPTRLLAQFFTHLQSSLVLLDSVRSVFDATPKIVDRPEAHSDFDPKADIVFENASFKYDDQDDVCLFSDLNMRLQGGKTTAIVGSTGSGKTTVLSLISRLYDVTDGAVKIDGSDLRDLKVAGLRSVFSVVAQDIVIFDASIWDNIKYVRPDASDADVWAAAEAADVADLMRQRGEEKTGPHGSHLSGGQKQRIAIARAFLRDAPILLLDEATSALDQKTEAKIQGALQEVGKDKTTIIVSHRLSAVVDADWIYVLDFGNVVAEGTHKSLMKEGGLYASMYQSQKDGYS